jgi:hypothetical protein
MRRQSSDKQDSSFVHGDTFIITRLERLSRKNAVAYQTKKFYPGISVRLQP